MACKTNTSTDDFRSIYCKDINVGVLAVYLTVHSEPLSISKTSSRATPSPLLGVEVTLFILMTVNIPLVQLKDSRTTHWDSLVSITLLFRSQKQVLSQTLEFLIVESVVYIIVGRRYCSRTLGVLMTLQEDLWYLALHWKTSQRKSWLRNCASRKSQKHVWHLRFENG